MLIWDTVKAFVRGIFKVAVIQKKREFRKQEDEIKELVLLREEQVARDPNERNKAQGDSQERAEK